MPPFSSTWLSSYHPDKQSTYIRCQLHPHTSCNQLLQYLWFLQHFPTTMFYDSSVTSSLTEWQEGSVILFHKHVPALVHTCTTFSVKHMLTLAHACSTFSHLLETYFQTSKEDASLCALLCPQPRSQHGGWCTSGTDIKNCLHMVNFVETRISCCSIRALWNDLQTVHLFVLIVILGIVSYLSAAT